jgi:cobalt-zinc-cadmium efflux system protein
MSYSHNHHVDNLRLAFFLNLGFAIFEFGGGLWTNSIALMAGALHDFGDAITLAVSWHLERVSKKEKNAKYSYGYQRFSLLSAVISAIVLITGAVFVLFEAIPRLITPEHSNAQGMVVFAVIGIAINGIAVLRIRNGKNMNARMITWHLVDDVLSWAAVLIMSLVLLIADIHILDPILSLLITTFVLYNVVKNLGKTLSLFLQAVPDAVGINEIENRIKKDDMVKDMHDTHIWSLDGEKNVLTTHIVLVKCATQEDMSRIKCIIHDLIPKYDFAHTTIEFEYLDEDCSMNNQHENGVKHKAKINE